VPTVAEPAPGADWKLENAQEVGGGPALVLGGPRVEGPQGQQDLVFNGRTDGVIVPTCPLAGWANFTVEVLFRPDSDGPAAQRFIHMEDGAARRLTFETRILGGQWAMDTYLQDGASKRPLLDPKLLHPADRWYWAALRYDGRTMTSFVNGVEELSGPVTFGPMAAGRVGIGVRLNRVFWFKGAIRELRFYPVALAASDLARVP
jgi:hypothetical protein